MKTSIEHIRVALNGPTMGTRWSVLFFAAPDFDPNPLRIALQDAVNQVDAQMSTWRSDSALMRLNAAPVGEWVSVPAQLKEVLGLALAIGRASEGAFDIAVGDAVAAWGFGNMPAAPDRIAAAMSAKRTLAHEALTIDGRRVCKHAPVVLDLNGIAKGYGVDRLADTLRDHGITDALVGIDGEMCAIGMRPDQQAWTIAVESPDLELRSPYSILELHNAAVATSGDYRHWVEVHGRRLSHTMAPNRGAPLVSSPASVTVVAPTCAKADAWATALMVLGGERGAEIAHQYGLNVLFLLRNADSCVTSVGVGPLFSCSAMTIPSEGAA